MKRIKERNLIKLGFDRVDVPIQESGDKEYYYFVMDIGNLELITCADDECHDSNWYVEIFDCDEFRFYSLKKLKKLIKLLKSGLYKNGN